ncbi:MAG: hypothetical protein DWQ36_24820 [Acidobacteria bacterium]|nr:MAG: hypothetical protein DWQ36_24820 [Acidobacteriota bacterium]
MLAAMALACALTFVACGPSQEEQAAAARAEEWAQIEAMQAELNEKRQALAEAVETAQSELEVAEGESIEEVRAAAEERVRQLTSEVDDMAATFGERLVAFINDDPMEVGAEPTEVQLGALRMKSSEDLLIAEEFIAKGGDWARAGDIVERALAIDPDNPDLLAKKAEIEEMRFVTQERFERVEKGMTQDEVIAILGPVNINNIREFDDSNLGWFYRKDPDTEGGAAGVYFRLRGGEWTVETLDYEAIKAQDE